MRVFLLSFMCAHPHRRCGHSSAVKGVKEPRSKAFFIDIHAGICNLITMKRHVHRITSFFDNINEHVVAFAIAALVIVAVA